MVFKLLNIGRIILDTAKYWVVLVINAASLRGSLPLPMASLNGSHDFIQEAISLGDSFIILFISRLSSEFNCIISYF